MPRPRNKPDRITSRDAMLIPEGTPRQRIVELLTGTRLSSFQLAQMLGIAERQVEEHLTHVVKTIARDKTRQFIMDPARCQDCAFIFRDRSRLTRPSRCPHCRSEAIATPRFGIELAGCYGKVEVKAEKR